MADRRVRIASRGSRLALTQAEQVRGRLAATWPEQEFEIVTIETRGDREIDRPIPEIGGKGLFTEALEEALLEGRADLAVHSLKDLPTEMPDGLKVGAVLAREDARDVWVARDEGSAGPDVIPAGAVVGTSSERRRAQLLALRPDLTIGAIRGNVETRIRKLDEGQYDALILAAAGLIRLGLAHRITAYLESPGWLPAPGQGAIAVQSRIEDGRTDRLLEGIEDRSARAETVAERALLHTLQGGCQIPVGARAVAKGGTIILYALIARSDGSRVITGEARGNQYESRALGERLAGDLIARGADAILERFRERRVEERR